MRGVARLVVLAIALGAVGWVASGSLEEARALPWEGREWRAFHTEHFVVLSDATPSQARDLAADLETLRRVLGEVTDLQMVSPVPTVVFLFQDEGSMRGYRHLVRGRPATLDGGFYSAPHADFLIINGRQRREATVTVFHELVHKVLRDNLPGLPLWLEEGMAELFSTVAMVCPKGGEEAILGAPVARNVDVLRSREPMALRDLLAVRAGSDAYVEFEHQGVFYAQSWLLAHCLWLAEGDAQEADAHEPDAHEPDAREPDRRAQALDYVSALLAGASPDAAFASSFGVDHAVVEAEIARCRSRGLRRGFPLRRVPLDDLPPVRVASRALRHVDLLVHLGELLASQPGREVDARRHFRAALEGDNPLNARAWAGLGLLEERRGEISRARALYAEAMRDDRRAAGPGDALVPYLYASSLVVFGRGTPRAKLLEARDHLLVSLERDPSFAPAWARLRAVERHLEIDGPSPLPDRPDVALRLLVLYARGGAREAARRLVTESFEPHASPEVLTEARRVIERMEWLAAERDEAPELILR